MLIATDRISKQFFSFNLICTRACIVLSIITIWASVIWTSLMVSSLGIFKAFAPEIILVAMYSLWIPSKFLSQSALEKGSIKTSEMLLIAISFLATLFYVFAVVNVIH